jgi:hypothetical protein
MNKEESLETIVAAVYALDNPKIEESRREQIKKFIISTVNGDNPITYLVVNATLRNGHEGAICYILTDKRFIKIDVSDGTAKEVQSASYPLNTLTGVERKLVEGGKEQFDMLFRSASFGLKYSQDDKDIVNFFQKVDQYLREDN